LRPRCILSTGASSHLPLVCQLVVASPVVACFRLASHFVGQPPHASILLDPSSLFTPAGCCVASLRTASASRRAGAIAGVIKCTAPVRPPAHRKAPPTPLQRRCAAACAPRCTTAAAQTTLHSHSPAKGAIADTPQTPHHRRFAPRKASEGIEARLLLHLIVVSAPPCSRPSLPT
jgi:hypothetical protein